MYTDVAKQLQQVFPKSDFPEFESINSSAKLQATTIKIIGSDLQEAQSKAIKISEAFTKAFGETQIQCQPARSDMAASFIVVKAPEKLTDEQLAVLKKDVKEKIAGLKQKNKEASSKEDKVDSSPVVSLSSSSAVTNLQRGASAVFVSGIFVPAVPAAVNVGKESDAIVSMNGEPSSQTASPTSLKPNSKTEVGEKDHLLEEHIDISLPSQIPAKEIKENKTDCCCLL